MRSTIKILGCCWLFLSVHCDVARADGGRIVLVEQKSHYRIAVFAFPNPLRTGPIDISVLLQDADNWQPFSDALVKVKLVSRDKPGTVIHSVATRAAATNKLLYAALVELPVAGWWDVEVEYSARQQDPVTVRFALEAGQRFLAATSMWPWFTWPFGAVLLFGIHRVLIARNQVRKSQRPRLTNIAAC